MKASRARVLDWFSIERAQRVQVGDLWTRIRSNVVVFFHKKAMGHAVVQGHNHPREHILATKLHNSCASATEVHTGT